MNDSQTMFDTPSTFRSLYWPVAIVLALLLALLWLMGHGPGGKACSVATVAAQAPAAPAPAPAPAPATGPATAVAPTPAPAATAAPATVPAATAASLLPSAKLYFAVNSFELADEEKAKMAAVLDYLKGNASAKAVLSGFHDPSGNKAANEELALNRARAVRTLLEGAGIDKERVVMAKPAETTGGGPAAEARRVELSVQP